MYNHCNICNILVYFCNIRIKHLQHIPLKFLKHTLAICTFSTTSPCCLGEWRLIDAKLNTGVELDAAEWRAAPVEKVVPVEKAASAVEDAVAGRWPMEKKDGAAGGGARAHGGQRGRQLAAP
jgi:hypothetical protein